MNKTIPKIPKAVNSESEVFRKIIFIKVNPRIWLTNDNLTPKLVLSVIPNPLTGETLDYRPHGIPSPDVSEPSDFPEAEQSAERRDSCPALQYDCTHC